MKLLQTADQEWQTLKCSIAAGTPPAGIFMVLGCSEEMTAQAQTLLEDTSQAGYHVRYFLCSGSEIFRLPCFLPFTDTEVTPEPVNATHFLTGDVFARESPVKRALSEKVEELEQMALRQHQSPQLILLEYLTPPSQLDLSFIASLLRSEVPQRIPVILLVHQPDVSDNPAWQDRDTIESILTLYLCGGRMRRADWQKIRDQLPEKSICDRFLATRRVGADSRVCYASRQVAAMAEHIFQTTAAARKRELARSLLQVLPHSTGYPLLAIAAETDDMAMMLSIYSQATANIALSEPEGLVGYFDHLQKIAQKAQDATLMYMAHVSYLGSQFLSGIEHSLHIYQSLQGTGLPDGIDRETEGFFWNTLGQQFVKTKRAEDWEYAADCFRLSRACFQEIDDENRSGARMGLALIANGEALIAYKRQQGEKAQQLEEFALEQSKDMTLAPIFQVLVRINLGDVFVRSLSNTEAALMRYGEALLLVSQLHKKFRLQAMPKRLAALKQQAALKLASTFVQAGRYHEAIDFLEHFLSYAKKDTGVSRFGEESSITAFKTRLVLAQAYLETGQQRKAAASYWYILRHPQWLEPVALQEVRTKLGNCRPVIYERLQRRIEQIVSEQEAIIADAMKVQDVLTHAPG